MELLIRAEAISQISDRCGWTAQEHAGYPPIARILAPFNSKATISPAVGSMSENTQKPLRTGLIGFSEVSGKATAVKELTGMPDP